MRRPRLLRHSAPLSLSLCLLSVLATWSGLALAFLLSRRTTQCTYARRSPLRSDGFGVLSRLQAAFPSAPERTPPGRRPPHPRSPPPPIQAKQDTSLPFRSPHSVAENSFLISWHLQKARKGQADGGKTHTAVTATASPCIFNSGAKNRRPFMSGGLFPALQDKNRGESVSRDLWHRLGVQTHRPPFLH